MKNLRTYDLSLIERVTKNGKKFIFAGAFMLSALNLTACSSNVNEENYSNEILANDLNEVNNPSFDSFEQSCNQKMQAYTLAKETFEEDKNVQNRMNVVKTANDMSDAILMMTKQKAKEAIGTDKEILFDTDPEHVHFKVCEEIGYDYYNSQTKYSIKNTVSVDNDLFKLAQDINAINIYKGSGENEVWENEINKYIKVADRLYDDGVQLINKDFIFENNKISVPNSKKLN